MEVLYEKCSMSYVTFLISLCSDFSSSAVGFHIRDLQGVRIAEEQSPELFQEAVYAVDTVRIPGLGLFYRAEEHLIHTQRIRTVFLYNHIGINHVEHGFAHLFNSPAADVFAVFQDKLCGSVLRTPCLECFRVENVVGHDVDIHMERGSVVLVFQIQRYECIGILDAIYKVASSLNHTLVHQFLERLFDGGYAEVVQELFQKRE